MNYLFDIQGKVALVTGGATGIGKMIATAYVKAGVKVYISSRKREICDQVAGELSEFGTCIAIPSNLSIEEGCHALAKELIKREEKLHILVNNAGATWGAPLEEHNEASFERVLSLNVKGVFHLTKFLLPLLRAAGTPNDPARVINIGSIDGLAVSMFEIYSYSASKAALHHMTRHMAKDLGPSITLNCIAPGPFESKMTAGALCQFGQKIVASAPMKRIGQPDDIAGAAIYLASPAASYLTGVILPVDGGITIGPGV